jgi:transcription antitermination protein NusB
VSDPAGLRRRRDARERALEILYEADAKGCAPAEVLAGLAVDPDPFAVDVVRGVSDHLDESDLLIRRFSRGWALERMPVIDRTLLRMATYELGHRPDVPVGAVISEAVELAKRYSTDDSGRFVNGVLGSIAEEVRAGEERERREEAEPGVRRPGGESG